MQYFIWPKIYPHFLLSRMHYLVSFFVFLFLLLLELLYYFIFYAIYLYGFLFQVLCFSGSRGQKAHRTSARCAQTVEKVAEATFSREMRPRRTSIPDGKVGPPWARSVISEAHVPGNDGFSFDSCGYGRRNSARLSLKEGFSTASAPEPSGSGAFSLTGAVGWHKITGIFER